ncbi:MAG TPA: xanthine dehydrogenase family protein subunit M [Candidatus Saccharimonadales bacterium]|nr:xanthine dehydrogenase family protein subunit M [Candidatus Saccharimonadales bacterium]
MNPFDYQSAETPENAIAAVAAHPQASFLAGGTTLIDLMKLNVETPRTLIDINALALAKIEEAADGGVRIGAMVRNSDLANDARIQRRYPVLSEALLAGASPQLRNMATVGGNLRQRTRCYYFRDTFSACNKRNPGTGCAAVAGYNRIHAVLGTSEKCLAAFPGDMPVAMTALDAVIHTRRADGSERAFPITDFYVGYGDDPAKETVLDHGELIVAVELPALPWLAHSAYVKVRDRASYDFALASAAVAVDVNEGKIRNARVAVGGVATKPWRSPAAEKSLTGQPPGEQTFRAAAEAALDGARAWKDNGFKIELSKRTLVRALQTAAAKAG